MIDPQDWVRLEIEAAIKRGVRVIPVLVDGAGMPSASELPPSLRGLARRQAMALSSASLDIRRLVSVLETALAHEQAKRQSDTRTQELAQPARSRANRLLMSAVRTAFTLTGSEKANALAVIIRAPSRAGDDTVT